MYRVPEPYSILEQLVDSRAFLAFALVVVALAARLHSLFGVLFDDLDRATATLSNLVEANKVYACAALQEVPQSADARATPLS